MGRRKRKYSRFTYDNTVTMQAVLSACTGAQIAVVGNAISLIHKNHGDAIDAADVVFRFNGNLPYKPDSQGNKTTYMVMNGMVNFMPADPVPVIAMRDYAAESRAQVMEFESFPRSVSPTTGIRLLSYLIGYNVTIYGFDGFVTGRVGGGRMAKAHNKRAERQYLNYLHHVHGMTRV